MINTTEHKLDKRELKKAEKLWRNVLSLQRWQGPHSVSHHGKDNPYDVVMPYRPGGCMEITAECSEQDDAKFIAWVYNNFGCVLETLGELMK